MLELNIPEGKIYKRVILIGAGFQNGYNNIQDPNDPDTLIIGTGENNIELDSINQLRDHINADTLIEICGQNSTDICTLLSELGARQFRFNSCNTQLLSDSITDLIFRYELGFCKQNADLRVIYNKLINKYKLCNILEHLKNAVKKYLSLLPSSLSSKLPLPAQK